MAKKKKVYTSDQVETVKQMKRNFPKLSIRNMAKITGIPKSVVGRWTKEPQVWKEKYRFNKPEHIKMTDKQFTALQKFKKKVKDEKKVDSEKYQGLMIKFTEDGEMEVYSG